MDEDVAGRRYVCNCGSTRRRVHSSVAHGHVVRLAITRIDSAAFLGRVGLDRISASGTANVGYWVRTGQTGQGVATAAVLLIARFGFEDLGLQRLELLVAADNLASRRVAEKVGATFEGVLPAGPHGQGELEHTSYCFSLDR